jgi:flagellar basal-body rod protein FlgB
MVSFSRGMVNPRLTLFVHTWSLRILHDRAMAFTDIPLLSMLKGRMGYLSKREGVVAENVANSDTPGFTPKDLKPFSFEQAMARQGVAGRSTVNASPEAAAAMARMSHNGVKRTTSHRPVDAPDSETTLDGNQVVLEDQMVKMNETRLQYDAAISFYQKATNLIRLASRAPGR